MRNGRGISGLVLRSTMIPAETMTNASSVPIETSSPRRAIGNAPAINAQTMPVRIVVMYGVRNFVWTLLNTGGSSPSRDIV